MFEPEFIAKMKERLLTEQRQVEHEIANLSKFEEPNDNPEYDDVAQDAADDILGEMELKNLKKLKEQISAALDRIEQGTYGFCLKTGKAMPKELLIEEPWAEVLPPIMN